MPKDWMGHKAELERLYIEENKTLSQIKKILEAGGFNASIRSYRTRFREWGFTKYEFPKSQRAPRIKGALVANLETTRDSGVSATASGARRNLEQLPYSHDVSFSDEMVVKGMNPQTAGDWISIGKLKIPRQPMDAKLLESFVPFYSDLYLYALMVKWRPEAGYMEALDTILLTKTACKLILEPLEPVRIGEDFVARHIFEVIAGFVPHESNFQVTKRLLLAAGTSQYSQVPWVEVWLKAKGCHEWEAVRVHLQKLFLAVDMNQSFMKASRVIVAESMLSHFYNSYVKGVHICVACQYYDDECLRYKCMEILDYFSDVKSSECDVDPKYYWLSLKISVSPATHEREVVARMLEIQKLELQKLAHKETIYRQFITNISKHVALETFDEIQKSLLNVAKDQVPHEEMISEIEMFSLQAGCSIGSSTVRSVDVPLTMAPSIHNPQTKTSPIVSLIQVHDFENLYNAWITGPSSPFDKHYHKFHTVLTYFRAPSFNHLIRWMCVNVDQACHKPFVNAMVGTFIYLSLSYGKKFPPCIHSSDRVPCWNSAKCLVIGDPHDTNGSLRLQSRATALLKHTLLMFGESFLSFIGLKLDASQMFNTLSANRTDLIAKCKSILHDFGVWGIQAHVTIMESLSPHLLE